MSLEIQISYIHSCEWWASIGYVVHKEMTRDARRRCKIWRFRTFSGDVKGSEFGVEVLLHSYTHIYIYRSIIEGSLEVKLPTIWTDEKQSRGEAERRGRLEERRAPHFQVKSVKNWRSRTTFGSWDVEKVSKKCTPLWREAHFEVKSVNNWGFWAFFDVEMSKK